MRSALSFRSYSFIIFGFCLLFLLFGYRTLRHVENRNFGGSSGKGDSLFASGYYPLLQAKCEDISHIGEHSICSAKNLNNERNCLIFSVATRTDLKFELDISKQMDKCKVRVYDHEAKATDSDGRYRVVEKVETENIDAKLLKKIIDTERKAKKIHLFRLEAGENGAHLAQSKLLKERSVCQLLLSLYKISEAELVELVKTMKDSFEFSLFGVREMEQNGEEEEEEEEEEGEEEKKGRKEEKRSKKVVRKNLALSFIAQHCTPKKEKRR